MGYNEEIKINIFSGTEVRRIDSCIRYNELYIATIYISFEKNTLNFTEINQSRLFILVLQMFGLVISAFPVALLFVGL